MQLFKKDFPTKTIEKFRAKLSRTQSINSAVIMGNERNETGGGGRGWSVKFDRTTGHSRIALHKSKQETLNHEN